MGISIRYHDIRHEYGITLSKFILNLSLFTHFMTISDKKINKKIYICFVLIAGLSSVTLLLCHIFSISIQNVLFSLIPPCIFREYTGIYCPGCGGVRASIYLLHGNLMESLWYHPFVLYATVLIGLFFVSYTLYLITNKECFNPELRPIYFYSGAGIILLQWIIKNIFLLGFGIALIP